MALTGPPAELWVTPPAPRAPGALSALWGAVWQSAADLWRAVSLLLLFAPAALAALPALQYGWGRGAWMLLLRCATSCGKVVPTRVIVDSTLGLPILHCARSARCCGLRRPRRLCFPRCSTAGAAAL